MSESLTRLASELSDIASKIAGEPEVKTASGSDVAKTIRRQLGRKFEVMVGAKSFIIQPSKKESELHGELRGGLSFRFMKPQGRMKPNHLKIILNNNDTYDLYFGNIRGYNFKVIKEFHGIYANNLHDVFERYTGLATSL